MKYKKISALLLATSLILVGCSEEKEKEKEVEKEVEVEQKEPQVKEPEVEKVEENIEEKNNKEKYNAPPNSEWIGISGTIKEQVDDETVLITTEEGVEIHFNVVPELRESVKTGAKGESISFDYYEKGESKVIAKILFNDRVPEKTNQDTTTIHTDSYEFQGLADSRSMQVMKDNNYYFPELNEQQIKYLEENVEIGDKIEMSFIIDEYGVYVVKSIQKKD